MKYPIKCFDCDTPLGFIDNAVDMQKRTGFYIFRCDNKECPADTYEVRVRYE